MVLSLRHRGLDMFSHYQGKARTGKTFESVRELLASGDNLAVVYKSKSYIDSTVLLELKDAIGENFEKFPLQYDSVWYLASGQVIRIVSIDRVAGLGTFDAMLIDDEDWSMRELEQLRHRTNKLIWAHNLVLV